MDLTSKGCLLVTYNNNYCVRYADQIFCEFNSGLESAVFLEVLNRLHPILENDGFLPYVQRLFSSVY